MPTRWRWPPENSCGYRLPCSGLSPTSSSSSATRALPCLSFFHSPWTFSGSPMMSLTGIFGFSEAYGSWKTICSSRRTGRIS